MCGMRRFNCGCDCVRETAISRKWWHNFLSFWGKLGHQAAKDTGLLEVGCVAIDPDIDPEWSFWLWMWGQIGTVVFSYSLRDARIEKARRGQYGYRRRGCSRTRNYSSGLITLESTPYDELKPLTDEEIKHTIACYCDKCGTELRIHLLFPLVGGKSLEHACVAKPPPPLFRIELIELKPMELPKTGLFYLDPFSEMKDK